jgi:hypothetical protein
LRRTVVNVETRYIRNKMENPRAKLTEGNRIFEEIGVGNFVAQRRSERVCAFLFLKILY